MASAALRRLVLGVLSPAHHCRLFAPERQRQHLGLVGQAGEALDGNEAVDLLELGPQRRRDVEIVALAARLRPHLEDHHVHVSLPPAGCSGTVWQSGRAGSSGLAPTAIELCTQAEEVSFGRRGRARRALSLGVEGAGAAAHLEVELRAVDVRSEESREGKEWVSTFSSRRSPYD